MYLTLCMLLTTISRAKKVRGTKKAKGSEAKKK